MSAYSPASERRNPKISVITVCFNSEATIRDTIRSVNQQSYANLEHVFVDGASSDNTLGVINSDSGVENIVISEPDSGIYDALNKGINAASGDILGFLHADDFFADTRVLEKIAHGFAEQSIGGVYGDLKYISGNNIGNVIRHWQAREYSPGRLRLGWMPPHPTFYVRKFWYERIGGFDTRYGIAGDYFSILRLFAEPEFSAKYIPEVLVMMRVGGTSNRSLKNIIKKSCEDLDAVRRSGVGGVETVIAKNLRKVGQFIY